MPATPIRQQYLRVKQRYPGAIVLFRLGDFYETFDEDARVAARVLGIALTGREMGKGLKVPMAGIPYHALDNYLGKLLAAGHRVAICEQLGEATGRGLVERDVVRVVTPGTVVEPSLLEQKSNNYLAAVAMDAAEAGIAYIDITTSEFAVTQAPLGQLRSELERLHPSEVLVPEGAPPEQFPVGVAVTPLEAGAFDEEEAQERLLRQLGVATLEGYGCARLPLAVRAAGAVVFYLEQTQKATLAHVTGLTTYSTQRFMVLDPQTRNNLGLFSGGRSGRAEHSLLAVLDFTRTAMGGRLLKRWLGQPLLDVGELERRLDGVQWLVQREGERRRLATLLGGVADLERLVNRVRGAIATPRDLVALRRSLEAVPQLRQLLGQGPAPAPAWLLSGLWDGGEVVELIARAIVEEPPALLADGGYMKEGFSPELDELRRTSRSAREAISAMERRERERTGIKSLKVGYNRVFGYYIEVSKPHLAQVPPDYIRKQTVATGERFVTPELKELESRILHAQEGIGELEAALFRQVCGQTGAAGERLLESARCIAQVDVLCSLAEAAARHGYTRPRLVEEDIIHIVNGRHPVVERTVAEGTFVPNDTLLSRQDARIVVLTGPNMAGKSTYLRQVALIVLMAQVGGFVPAEAATIGIVDRIFTRIGLQDDLAVGQSTFMVEMMETAQILHQATARSLIILDEIGRGTSTYDGLSIARAVAEYIHSSPRLGAKTLFATHYHELTELASSLPHVRNYNVAVSDEGGQVVFLHRIVPGAADRSYGVHVAQLAGLPRPVVRRAQEVLQELEVGKNHAGPAPRSRGPGKHSHGPASEAQQLPLLGERPAWVKELAGLDLDSLSPLEALTKLYPLQKKAKEE